MGAKPVCRYRVETGPIVAAYAGHYHLPEIMATYVPSSAICVDIAIVYSHCGPSYIHIG